MYNKPNQQNVVGLFQKDATLHTIANNFQRKGFVFAPFNSEKEAILFPLEFSDCVFDVFEKKRVNVEKDDYFNDNSKKNHVALVEKAVDAIHKNRFEKVVLSRKEIIALEEVDIWTIYNRLLQNYPNAFVYVWFHPAIGLWFGATPETLVKVEDNRFSTMALAGTQVYKEKGAVHWTSKEVEEQELVTAYIIEKLSTFSADLKKSATETVRAGTLLHLQTKIDGKLNEMNQEALFDLIQLLHPTPAVCGFPKDVSKEFILEHEDYNRSYYTGFLGELNLDFNKNKNSHLFVNLRCMEVENYTAAIYVGGGITSASNPVKEWEETVAKSNIMYKVL